MNSPSALLARLDAIAHSLEQSGHALALIGLGSAGAELDRLDAYSDLDFFAIVEARYKLRYIENLDWLSSIAPITYHFRNTPDGHKLLFRDGIFCEFAVFEQTELKTIPFARGRIIWKKPQVDDAIGVPVVTGPLSPNTTAEWLLGEALTNLYVGLSRLRRGEKLSAARFIQGYAVDRVLGLAPRIEPDSKAPKDAFALERRFEQRFPGVARALPAFVQGYERSPESAQAILEYLEQHFEVNQAMAEAIRELCGEG
jgi:lincosamide nucleotidyltransferase